jgi:tRNA(fMet)-specific endonuclease VapC
LVALLRGDDSAAARIGDLESRGVPMSTTPINAYELFTGAWRSVRREVNLKEVAGLLRDLPMLVFDVDAAFQIARIHAALSVRGESIGVEDEFIAGVAVRHGEPLVTRNLSHFGRIPGLDVESW